MTFATYLVLLTRYDMPEPHLNVIWKDLRRYLETTVSQPPLRLAIFEKYYKFFAVLFETVVCCQVYSGQILLFLAISITKLQPNRDKKRTWFLTLHNGRSIPVDPRRRKLVKGRNKY